MADNPAGGHRVLRNLRMPGRASLLQATIGPAGEIRIHGLDSGNGVAEGDEYSHYEWTWTLGAGDVPAAMAALGAADDADPLDTFEAWVNEHLTDPGMVIRTAGVPIEFSSRLAD